jgi:hypothetical protein
MNDNTYAVNHILPEAKKEIYVRNQLDRMLFGLLGRREYVDLWWTSSNKAFDGKTPDEVYHSGKEGRVMVADYIISHCDGSFH